MVRFTDEEVSMIFDLYWLKVYKEASCDSTGNLPGGLYVPDATEYFEDVMSFIHGEETPESIKNAEPTLKKLRTRYRQSRSALLKNA